MFAGSTRGRVPKNAERTPTDPHGLRDAIERSPYTQEQVIARTYGNPRKPNGLSKSTLTKAIRGGDESWPTDETILILGEAMEAEPGHWPEYDLARAREQLNPRFVPRAQALANYNTVRDALDLGLSIARSADRRLAGNDPASPGTPHDADDLPTGT